MDSKKNRRKKAGKKYNLEGMKTACRQKNQVQLAPRKGAWGTNQQLTQGGKVARLAARVKKGHGVEPAVERKGQDRKDSRKISKGQRC